MLTYQLQHGTLVLDPARESQGMPIVKVSFTKI